MRDKMRSIAQRVIDDPLIMWLVVGVLIAEGVLLFLYITEVL